MKPQSRRKDDGMKLQRRGFLKAVTAGLAIQCASGAFAQGAKREATGELDTSCETLHLKGGLKSGELTLEAQQFWQRKDRSVIVRGKLGRTELYSAMFSYQKDLTVFALFNDNDHATTVILSDSTDPKIGQVVIWNDNNAPQIYKVDKRKIMETDSPKELRDVDDKPLDLAGKRNQPAFTWQELEAVFGSDPALLQFMRGKKSTHHSADDDKIGDWICRLLSMVPGSPFSLFWLA